MFAVIKTGGKQYTVRAGDVLRVAVGIAAYGVYSFARSRYARV